MMAALQARLERTSSTRSAALLRIGLALLLWERFGNFYVPFAYTLDPLRLLLSVPFWVFTACMLVGYRAQLATASTAIVLLVSWFSLGVFGDIGDFIHHHTWLMVLATVWLAFTPCGTSLSVDRWFAVRDATRNDAPIPLEEGPDWGLLLIALQVSAVYWWGAWDKTSWPFLSGDRLSMLVMHQYTGFRVTGWAFDLIMAFGAWAVVIVEYALPFGLFVRRWQPFATVAGIALHAVIYLTLPVGPFSAVMLLLYLAYYHPDDIHQGIETLLGRPPSP
ncbi:MAG: HTTM domain-containing protein [Myxococcota bacterium]